MDCQLTKPLTAFDTTRDDCVAASLTPTIVDCFRDVRLGSCFHRPRSSYLSLSRDGPISMYPHGIAAHEFLTFKQ